MHIHTVRHSQRRHLLAAHKIVYQQTGTVMGGGEAQEKSKQTGIVMGGGEAQEKSKQTGIVMGGGEAQEKSNRSDNEQQ